MSGPSAPMSGPSGQPARRRGAGRLRRASGVLVLLGALALIGGAYSAFAPSSQAATSADQSLAVRQGKALFNLGCATCHGANAQGVPGKAPSLIGVGSAAVDFQVSTGRMPLAAQGAQAPRKPPKYTADQIAQLGAYIQSLGGGPQLPPAGTNLRDGDLAQGGRLFRLNCASCHNFAGRGGALSSGKYAPNLASATDRQIYAAMLTGPGNMPVFGDNQLSPQDKRAIINYIQTLKASKDPGGLGLGRVGPVPEGLVIWGGGILALVLATLWIGVKS